MLVFSFFILIIGISFFAYCYLASKINSQHKQIIVLSRQNYELKAKLDKQPLGKGNLMVKFKSPSGSNGRIVQESALYICPLEDSVQLNKITKNTQVEVLDGAEVSGALWYEVALLGIEKINHKGWVKASALEVTPENNMYSI